MADATSASIVPCISVTAKCSKETSAELMAPCVSMAALTAGEGPLNPQNCQTYQVLSLSYRQFHAAARKEKSATDSKLKWWRRCFLHSQMLGATELDRTKKIRRERRPGGRSLPLHFREAASAVPARRARSLLPCADLVRDRRTGWRDRSADGGWRARQGFHSGRHAIGAANPPARQGHAGAAGRQHERRSLCGGGGRYAGEAVEETERIAARLRE